MDEQAVHEFNLEINPQSLKLNIKSNDKGWVTDMTNEYAGPSIEAMKQLKPTEINTHSEPKQLSLFTDADTSNEPPSSDSVPATAEKRASEISDVDESMTLREFYRKVQDNIKSQSDTIAVIMHWYNIYKGLSTVTKNEIKDAFQELRYEDEQMPTDKQLQKRIEKAIYRASYILSEKRGIYALKSKGSDRIKAMLTAE